MDGEKGDDEAGDEPSGMRRIIRMRLTE